MNWENYHFIVAVYCWWICIMFADRWYRFGQQICLFTSRYLTPYLYLKMLRLNIWCCCVSSLHALANRVRFPWFCLIVIIWNIWSNICKHFVLAAGKTNRSVMLNDNVTFHTFEISLQKLKQYCTPVRVLIYQIHQLFFSHCSLL